VFGFVPLVTENVCGTSISLAADPSGY